MAMNEEMKQNIMDYANQIQTIHDFMEAVRKTIGQYLGYTGNRGFMNMFREIFQNSVDERQKDSSPCTTIIVSYDERTLTTIVEDNGRGIPFDNIVRIFSEPHTSSNYEKKEGEFSSGRHGVGSKVTNAASSEFFVESYNSILQEARRLEFYLGSPWDKGEVKIPYVKGKQGTKIEFRPSIEVMGEITVTCEDILGLILLLLPLLKIDTVIHFNGIKKDGTIIQEDLINEDGIITGLIQKTVSPLIKPIVISKVTGVMKAEIAFTYDSSSLVQEDITSFSNFCPTVNNGSTHVSGFIDGLTTFFRNYMNKIYLKQGSKLTILNNDIKVGLKCIISAAHLEPIWTGQAKEILSNDDMHGFIKTMVMEYLEGWIKENPNELQRLCKLYKDVAEIRVKGDDSKLKLSKNYQTSALSQGLPSTYRKPNNKEDIELVILEGESALAPATNTRCHNRQGLYPIRGKFPNAMKKSTKDMLGNVEVNSILNIIGAGYGKNFDISKTNISKIIFLCDADPDASHIRCLLLIFLLMYCRPMVEDGRVYAAMPPLYGLELAKNKYKYFVNEIEFIKYVQKSFSKSNSIATIKGKTLSELEVVDLLHKNAEFVYHMNNIATTFALNPYLLELALVNRNLKEKDFAKVIKGKNRFIQDVSMVNGSMVIKGLVDSKINTLIMNDKLITLCDKVMEFLDNSPNEYLLNGEPVSLYRIMSIFDTFKPDKLKRYKGLGEMNEEQLQETSLHPDMNRTLIRYTSEDIMKEIEQIRFIESNKNKLLSGLKESMLLK